MKIDLFMAQKSDSGYPKELIEAIFGKRDDYKSCLATTNPKKDARGFSEAVIVKGRAIIRTSINLLVTAKYNGVEYNVPYIDLFLRNRGVSFYVNDIEICPIEESDKDGLEDLYDMGASPPCVPLILGQDVDEDDIIPFTVNEVITKQDISTLVMNLVEHCLYYNGERLGMRTMEIAAIKDAVREKRIHHNTAYLLLLSYYKTAVICDIKYEIPLLRTKERIVTLYHKTADELYAVMLILCDNLYGREWPYLKTIAEELSLTFGTKRGVDVLLTNFKVPAEKREKINKLFGGS